VKIIKMVKKLSNVNSRVPFTVIYHYIKNIVMKYGIKFINRRTWINFYNFLNVQLFFILTYKLYKLFTQPEQLVKVICFVQL